MLVAMLIGVGASVGGVLISYHAGVSTGATIALCACVGFGACMGIAALRSTLATTTPREVLE